MIANQPKLWLRFIILIFNVKLQMELKNRIEYRKMYLR